MTGERSTTAGALPTEKEVAPPKPEYHAGTTSGWAVEARLNGDRPAQWGELLFDNRWRRVSMAKAPPNLGVPYPSFGRGMLEECGLLGYDQAQALRWWLHANAQGNFNLHGLETRLACYEITHRVEWVRKGEQDVVGDWE